MSTAPSESKFTNAWLQAVSHELEKREWSLNRLERELDLASGAVSRWFTGKRRPELESALKVQELLGVDPTLLAQPSADTTASSPEAR